MRPENLPPELKKVLPQMQQYYCPKEPNRIFFHPSGEKPKGIPQYLRKLKVLRGYPDDEGNAWLLWYVMPPNDPFPYMGEEPPIEQSAMPQAIATPE